MTDRSAMTPLVSTVEPCRDGLTVEQKKVESLSFPQIDRKWGGVVARTYYHLLVLSFDFVEHIFIADC